MPRAQRTKSAGHEALQRRVSERPGASFSGKLAGDDSGFDLTDLAKTIPFEPSPMARPAAAFTFWRQNNRSSSPPPPGRLDDRSS